MLSLSSFLFLWVSDKSLVPHLNFGFCFKKIWLLFPHQKKGGESKKNAHTYSHICIDTCMITYIYIQVSIIHIHTYIIYIVCIYVVHALSTYYLPYS